MDKQKQGAELPDNMPNYYSAISVKWEDCWDDEPSPTKYGHLRSPRDSFPSTGNLHASVGEIAQPILETAKMDEPQLPDEQSFISSFSELTMSNGYIPYDLYSNTNIISESPLYQNVQLQKGNANSFQLQNSFHRSTDEFSLMMGVLEDFDVLNFNFRGVQRPQIGIFETNGGFTISNPTPNPATSNQLDAAGFAVIPDEQQHFFIHQQSQHQLPQRDLQQTSQNFFSLRDPQEQNIHLPYLYNDVEKVWDTQYVTSKIRLLDEQKGRPLSRRSDLSYSSGPQPRSGLRYHSLSWSETPDTNIPSLCDNKSNSGDLLINAGSFRYFGSPNNAGKSTYHMAKDQDGCRSLQRKISEGRKKDIEKILLEVTDHMVELTMHPFGNYLVQKLLDVCDESQRMQVLQTISRRRGDLVRISCDMHGTRVVQKIIETLKTPEQFSIIVSCLKPNIVTLMKNPNGTHVAEHCLRYLPLNLMEFLFESVATSCFELATDRHGCCVLQKCITQSSGERRFHLTRVVALNSRILSQDEFGNYAIQFILDQKVPQATADIYDQLEGHFVDLSMQKYSSNVVEHCLKLGGEERRAHIIQELIRSPRLDQILQDPFGNYVIQSAIATSKGALRTAIVKAIKPHVPTLCTNPYGKKVLTSKCLKNVKWYLI